MTDPTKPRMETLSEAVKRLAAEGYGEDFLVDGEGVRARSDGRWFEPGDLVCEAIERFEGESDPEDQSILFALRDREGTIRGTLVAPFGPGADPKTAEVVRSLPQPDR